MLVDKQNELMSDLLFTVHQHGGDDVTWKPPITNCDRYYKVRWIYYKLQQALQSALIITNCDSTPGGNWRGSYSWGYKEYNAITMHTSLSQWHQLAHKIYWGSSIGFFIPVIPSPNLMQSRNPDDFLFWYPTSRDIFSISNLARILL